MGGYIGVIWGFMGIMERNMGVTSYLIRAWSFGFELMVPGRVFINRRCGTAWPSREIPLCRGFFKAENVKRFKT